MGSITSSETFSSALPFVFTDPAPAMPGLPTPGGEQFGQLLAGLSPSSAATTQLTCPGADALPAATLSNAQAPIETLAPTAVDITVETNLDPVDAPLAVNGFALSRSLPGEAASVATHVASAPAPECTQADRPMRTKLDPVPRKMLRDHEAEPQSGVEVAAMAQGVVPALVAAPRRMPVTPEAEQTPLQAPTQDAKGEAIARFAMSSEGGNKSHDTLPVRGLSSELSSSVAQHTTATEATVRPTRAGEALTRQVEVVSFAQTMHHAAASDEHRAVMPEATAANPSAAATGSLATPFADSLTRVATQPTTLNPQTLQLSLPQPPLQSPSWSQAAGERIAWMVQGEHPAALLEVSPDSLGPIQVRVELKEQGAQISLSAHQAVTASLLESHLPRLTAALEGQGVRVDQVAVSQQSFSSAFTQDGGGSWNPTAAQNSGDGSAGGQGGRGQPGRSDARQQPDATPTRQPASSQDDRQLSAYA